MKLKYVALGLLAAVLLSVGGAALWGWHQGYRPYVVRTGSMIPAFQPGDAVLDRPASAGYSVGDSLTVDIESGNLVTHRLVRIDKQGLLHTKGDANEKPDAWALPSDRVVGVVDRVLPNMGYALVFLRQKTGIAGVMTSALSIVLLWGLCFPASSATPAGPTGPSIPRQRRGPSVRIPRQRASSDPVPTTPSAIPATVERRMPPTPAPYRRMPPIPVPAH